MILCENILALQGLIWSLPRYFSMLEQMSNPGKFTNRLLIHGLFFCAPAQRIFKTLICNVGFQSSKQ